MLLQISLKCMCTLRPHVLQVGHVSCKMETAQASWCTTEAQDTVNTATSTYKASVGGYF